MRTVEKKVYYCDHCKKHMLTTYGMKNHESRCLQNPNRICTAPYCIAATGTDQELVDWVKDHATLQYDGVKSSSYSFDNQELIQELREKLEGCPVCVVAVFMQVKKQVEAEGNYIYWVYDDFKKDAEEMYKTYQEENAVWY